MPTRELTVLVSGASVAGPITAFWLRRFGFRPTVVERTSELRLGGGGHAVDLFDSALDVMGWMGVLDKVQNARTRTATVSLVRSGKPIVKASLDRLWEGVGERHIEIMRGDLAQILYEAGKNDLEYIFGDSISALNDTASRVEVTFRAHAATHVRLGCWSRRLTFDDPPPHLRRGAAVPAFSRWLSRRFHGA